MSIVTYENVDTPVFEIDFIRYLFANGEQGALWGPLPYYSDAAGTVEADWGDPVGNIPDASGNELDWTQVTSTARPILGRVPVGGRRNLLRWTEDFSNAAWGKNNATVSANAAVAPDGTLSGDKLIASATGGGHQLFITHVYVSGSNYAISCFAKPGEYSHLILTGRGEFGLYATVEFDLDSGTVSRSAASGSFVLLDSQATLQDGWQRCEVVFTAGAPLPVPRFYIGVSDGVGAFDGNGVTSFTGDGTSGIYIWGAQLETGSVATPYQRVGNAYDITEAGVKGIHYLRFDGTDDSEPTTLPAISGGTIVLAGTNGIWIDSLDFAGGEFSVGPDTYTGGPTGLMSILGDILARGCFVIDRALTPEEIAKVKGYYVARGSAGLIELGPELVTNGTFDTDLSGWVLATPGTSTGWVWDSGAASTNSSPEDKFVTMHQSGVLTTNDTYLVSADVQITSGTLRAYLGIGASPPDISWSSSGGKRSIATAITADSRFGLNINGGAVVSVDNVSLRRLILPGEMP